MRGNMVWVAVCLGQMTMGCTDKVGENTAPTAEITSPSESDEVFAHYPTLFSGQVSDAESDSSDLSVIWYEGERAICGPVNPESDGSTSCEMVLTETENYVNLEVTDPEGAVAVASYDVEVSPTAAPEVTIVTPNAEGMYYKNYAVAFLGRITDGEDEASGLTALWTGDVSGELTDLPSALTTDGETSGELLLPEGTHIISLKGTDSVGLEGTDTVTIQVQGDNRAPTCSITSPTDSTGFVEGTEVVFTGTAEDEDVPSDWLSVSWDSDQDGNLATSNASVDGLTEVTTSSLSFNTHQITLTVTDDAGEVCQSSIQVQVGRPPSVNFTSPSDGGIWNDGESATFSATVSDDADAPNEVALVWSSDVDGDFSSARADASGAASFDYAGLSAGAHKLTLMGTDKDGLTASDSVSIRVNSAPSQPVISIGPAGAMTEDDLVVSLVTPSSDPDGDTVTYSYIWSLNGVVSSASTSDTLLASSTKRGDVWSVAVTPEDGHTSGSAGSDSLTVANTPPVVASTALTPNPATVQNTLTCTPSSSTDADGDTVTYVYSWTVNSSVVSSETSSTLSSAHFSKGQTVECGVAGYDGTDTGLEVTSGPMTIGNAVPEITWIRVTPRPVYAATSNVCSYTFSDADGDGDSSTVVWKKNGVSAGTGVAYLGTKSRGDRLSCTVTPNDGTDTGTPVSDSANVINTPPIVNSASLSPLTAYETSSLTCTPGAVIDDDGDTVTLTYSWYLNGTAISGVGGTTLTGTHFNKLDKVYCEITPHDGIESNSSTRTVEITISNSKPTVSSVALSPTSPAAGQDIQCNATGLADDDPSDGVTAIYSWSVGGTVVSHTTQTLPASATSAGDAVICTVTPNDGTEDGTSVSSSAVTVTNTTPIVTAVYITPDPAFAGDTLTCNYTFFDVDGDADVSTVEWRKNGTSVGTGLTYTGPFIDDDIMTCTVTPNDGITTGAAEAGRITIENSKPVLSSTTLTPTVAREGDTLTCILGTATDADGDTITYNYRWRINAVIMSWNISFLDDSVTDYFEKGDRVKCDVAPKDGKTWGAYVRSNEVIIQNTAPVVSRVRVTPPYSYSTSTLTCDYDYFDADGDSDLSTFSWTVNGVVQSSTSRTLRSGFIDGDSIACTVTPKDSTDSGVAVTGRTGVNMKIIGDGTTQYLAWGLDFAGDINGDGHPDIIAGEHWDPEGGSRSGAGWLFLGPSSTLGSGTHSTIGEMKFVGEGFEDFAGVGVSAAGDINSDGYDDLLIGAWGYDVTSNAEEGAAYLFLGGCDGATSCGGTRTGLFALSSTGKVDLSKAHAKMVGVSANEHVGHTVSSARDVNGDGYDDMLLGGAYPPFWPNGVSYLVLGGCNGDSACGGGTSGVFASLSSGLMSLKDADVKFSHEAAADAAGGTVSEAGDVNDDGYDDLIIGSIGHDSGGKANAGAAYLMLGGCDGSSSCGGTATGLFSALSSGVVALSDADAKFIGGAVSDWAGFSVANAGDVNQDGYDDLLVGAPYADQPASSVSDQGASYLILGGCDGSSACGGSTSGLFSGLTSGEMGLSDADAIFWGISTNSVCGSAVAGGSDFDGDGYPDIAIGARSESSTTNKGEVYILYGGCDGSAGCGSVASGLFTQLTSGAMSMSKASHSFTGNGATPSHHIFGVGHVLAAGFDMNNDGFDDLLAGSPGEDLAGADAGAFYVLHGGDN